MLSSSLVGVSGRAGAVDFLHPDAFQTGNGIRGEEHALCPSVHDVGWHYYVRLQRSAGDCKDDAGEAPP